jgi:hypothetical protein
MYVLFEPSHMLHCTTTQHAASQQPACNMQRSTIHNSRSVTLSNTPKQDHKVERNKRILPVKNGAALINQFLTSTSGSKFMDNNFNPFRFK